MLNKGSLLICLIALSGCSNDKSADDTGETTGETTGQTTTAPATVDGEMRYSIYRSDLALEGVEVTTELGTSTSDADGVAVVEVPAWSPFQIVSVHPDYHSMYFFGYSCGPGCLPELDAPFSEGFFFTGEPMIAPSVSSEVASLFGGSVDAAKGHVIVSVLGPVSATVVSAIAGGEVSLSEPYGLAFVEDASARYGVSEGTESRDGAIGFMNIAPGPVTVTVDPPDGTTTCDIFPSEGSYVASSYEIEVYADTVSRLSFVCQ
jgi:hypothetical protein